VTLNQTQTFSLFLCGDVMTGRGVDQILPHPGNPVLYESFVRDARDYVELAERANGPVVKPVSFEYVWGDALETLRGAETDARIINLETSITRSDDFWRDKSIHYRMHPQNIGCLTAAGISACSLANNHLLDWGHAGLAETIDVLDRAGLVHAGAGRDATAAAAPTIITIRGKGRVLLFSLGSTTSGIPPEWNAKPDRPGVNLLEALSESSAGRVAAAMRQLKQSGDVAIASIHWGSNWGYAVPREQVAFAHRLIEEGFDIIHGHSSHHARLIEVFKDRLILYGCGDFINDYEGIGGHESFRSDLALMYLVKVNMFGRLVATRLVPFQRRRLQLHRAPVDDAAWLGTLLNRLGTSSGTRIRVAEENSLKLEWQ
jgi:poly-gamma-glutamate synthesis protein (capsule biosynthesis protein)